MPSGDELTDEVVRLYALPVDEFTAARNATVKEWKRAGRKDDAATIAALRKPSVIESAVNHTAHRDPGSTTAWAEATRAADAAQSATIGGADAADLRTAVAELRAATAALVDAVVATIGDDGRRDDVAALLRAVPTGAVHQVTAGVLGSADRTEDDLFAGAPTPPTRSRPEKRATPDRPTRTRAPASEPKREPEPEAKPTARPKPPPKPTGPSARERKLDVTVTRRREELDAATAARDGARSALDDATRRLDAATHDRDAAEQALADAEAELRTERATRRD